MPVYEYKCPSCDKVHELWRSMYDAEECRCPDCSLQMYKLISKNSFQLKGGGWYADGYCKKGEASAQTACNNAVCHTSTC